MRIGVPKETTLGERRVALVPESGKKLLQAGYEVAVEAGDGVAAGFPDAAFRDAGVVLESSQAAVLGSDLVLKVNAPEPHEVAAMRSGGIVLGSLMPLRNLGGVRALAERGVTSFSTDAIRRACSTPHHTATWRDHCGTLHHRTGRSGGTADAADSKSAGGNPVGVRIPLPAPSPSPVCGPHAPTDAWHRR